MSRVTQLPKVTTSSAPTPAPLPAPSASPTPTTPLEISQQLQRVEALHQQLKLEAQRAQIFLAKLRRGELEAQAHTGIHGEDRYHHHHHHHRRHEEQQHDRRRTTEEWEPGPDTGKCTCSRTHHSGSQPQGPTDTNGHTDLPRGPNASNLKESTVAPLAFPPRVDEREVRDLEKRVRGLEGRVRGFEGLPPDRELALLEVERLRRELEGLARRREGLFEGLGYEDAIRLGRASDVNARANKSNGVGSGSESTSTGLSQGSKKKTRNGASRGKGNQIHVKDARKH